MVGVLVAVVIVAEVLARRRGRPAVWNAPLLALGAGALVVWWAGSPESPVCDGGSWLQPHGLWHTLTALLVLGWVDQASYAADPERAPRLFRRATDRVIGLIATGLVLAFHRSVDVVGRENLPQDRPVLVVANHGNGFVDPIVVTSVLRRLPRFLAKAALWKVVVARPFLGFAGVLPVYRSSDGDRAAAQSLGVRGVPPGARQGRDGGHLPGGHDGRSGEPRSCSLRRRAHRPRRRPDGTATW